MTNTPTYTEADLRDALTTVRERTDEAFLSARAYERLRDDTHPHKQTVIYRLGSWTAAREIAEGESDE